MKRKIFLLFLLTVVLTIGCKTNKVTPLAEKIAKKWIASISREGTTVVYQQNGSGNIRPGYTSFTLNINSNGTVTFTDYDGIAVTGKWELQGETKLVLKTLSPAPTGTNGTIEFAITNFKDNAMTLTRTTTSLKTGGTINSYDLIVN